MAIITSPSPLPTILEGKRACSPSPAGKLKKSKGLFLPSDLISSPSKVLVAKAGDEDRASQEMIGATPVDASKALKVREEGLVTIAETQVEASMAQAPVKGTLARVTRVAAWVKATIAKVKQAVAPMGAGE